MGEESDGDKPLPDLQKKDALAAAAEKTPLVVRSNPPVEAEYGKYRQTLRHDFVYSCAYCTTTEAEAMGVNFTIDHYEPKISRSDLENVYGNLMYCCNSCNVLKGVRMPSQEARAAGWRFYRPDEDYREDHFRLEDLELKALSNTGSYTIDAVDLNRPSLKNVRSIRRRLRRCDAMVASGILALKNFPIDQLPQDLRGDAVQKIGKALDTVSKMRTDIDKLLEAAARSPLLDPDPTAGPRAKERAERIKNVEGLFAGNWSRPTKARRTRTKMPSPKR